MMKPKKPKAEHAPAYKARQDDYATRLAREVGAACDRFFRSRQMRTERWVNWTAGK